MTSKLFSTQKIILIVFSFVSILTYSQEIEFPEDKVKFEISLENEGCDAFIIARVNVVKDWHINAAHLPPESFSVPTLLDIDSSKNYILEDSIYEPDPHILFDSILKEKMYLHDGALTIKRKIKILSNENFILKGNFSYQTCDDTHCLPPFDKDFEINIKGCSEKSNSRSLWVIFLISFISGFAALLTPCVFPMIPMTVSFFTKQSQDKSSGIRNAIIYGICIILIYIVLGTIVTAIFGASALNALSTNVWFNIFFFLLLVVFAVSFMGAFEITLPNSWINKADSASNKGGFLGIFFMAFTLALVSFSCTGPIVGTLLVEAATIGGIGPFVGMFGFSLALALPFALFAAFPGWLNSLPKSGGWLNTVKVVLGFLELALAFKFLSNADLVIQGHYLEREVFLAIWIGIFTVLALYLFGFFRLPHDSPIEFLSVSRTILAITTLIFVIYLIPGLWGAPLKLISGFPPPMHYSESPMGIGNVGNNSHKPNNVSGENKTSKTHMGPQGIPVFHDLNDGLEYAKIVNKPAFLDFTGHACVNCRKMEEKVWGETGVIEILRDSVVIISLYVDDKRPLPENEHREEEIAPGKTIMVETIGDKWSAYQAKKYKALTQPYYRMLTPNGEDISNGSADYQHHNNASNFLFWLQKGLNINKEQK